MPVVLAFVWSATLGEGVLQGDVSLQLSLSLLSCKGVGKGMVNLPMGWYYGVYGMGCSQEKYPLNAFFQIIQKYKIQHTPLEFSLFCCWQIQWPNVDFPQFTIEIPICKQGSETELHKFFQGYLTFLHGKSTRKTRPRMNGMTDSIYLLFVMFSSKPHVWLNDSNDFLPSSLHPTWWKNSETTWAFGI